MHKPGTIVGRRYRCRHLLAEGGMAEVYLAESIVPHGEGELVALKRLLPNLATNPIFADMFAYEASLSSSFSHKNIVRCAEFFREEDDFYMVLEYVLGKEVGALRSLVKNWDTIERVKLAVAIGLQVTEALYYAHNREDQFGKRCTVVHGDISPQNIMVDISGRIKLYDFGAAKTCMSSLWFEEKVVRGNLRYMSPEQMAGDYIGPGSDIYSLCLILLEIILGDQKRFDRTDATFHKKIKDELFCLLLPVELAQLLFDFFVQGLDKDPRKRFSSCDELRAWLSNIALAVQLFDSEHYLLHIIKADGTSLQQKPIRRKNSFIGLMYLSMLATFLGLSVWVLTAIFAHQFESKHKHNLPVWPTEIKAPGSSSAHRWPG